MKRDLAGMVHRKHDLAIVGGGIMGAAIARDAALRGLSVALLEARDFSHATSAATSKLVHGGLRYLKTLDFGLVRESLAERRIWQRIAPHMVYPLPFLLPLHENLATTLVFHAGLTLYDLLAFDRNWLADDTERIPAHRWLGRKEALARVPLLSESGLRRAMLYYDCQMFAPERLALECLADAVAHGAAVANYAKVTALQRVSGSDAVEGIIAEDRMDGRHYAVQAELVVNATGPWADIALSDWGIDTSAATLVRAKGIHIITRALTTDCALTLPTDGGHLFVLPWRGHSLIGTTDTPFEGPPETASPTRAEIEGLIATLNHVLPGASLTLADVRYAFAGVRPLIAPASAVSTYKTSRRAEIIDHASQGGPARLISAIGGKWTTARHVAEATVDRVRETLRRPRLTSRTAERRLPGGDVGRFESFVARLAHAYPVLPSQTVQFLARSYGSTVGTVLALCREDAGLLEPLAAEHPAIGAQVIHAVEHEMALTLEDVVFRRTGLGTLGFPGEAALARAAALMATRLGWDGRECARQCECVQARFTAGTLGEGGF